MKKKVSKLELVQEFNELLFAFRRKHDLNYAHLKALLFLFVGNIDLSLANLNHEVVFNEEKGKTKFGRD